MDKVKEKQVPVQEGPIEHLWNGNLGLAMTYWVYGVLGGIVWGVVILALNPDPPEHSMETVLILFASYYFVVFVGIWRAANKYVENKAWAVLAKFAVVIIILPASIHLLKWFSDGAHHLLDLIPLYVHCYLSPQLPGCITR